MTRTVYLLHDLDRRLAQHRAGPRRPAHRIEVITQTGIGFRLARSWEGDRTLERRLKRRKEAPRLCPICTGRPRATR